MAAPRTAAPKTAAEVTRADVEAFLYHEAELLDSWRLDEWLGLLTEDAAYYVPPNDVPDGDHRNTLFTVADDINRIRARVKRLQSPEAHAEYPKSRTRRMISNVRITGIADGMVHAAANFVVYRFRRGERVGEYVGRYAYRLVLAEGALRIAERRAILDSEELGSLGSVSFIL